MNDRELLQMTAKALGFQNIDRLDASENPDGTWNFYGDCEGRTWHVWNPLTNDGDAFRAAFLTKISVCYSGDRHSVAFGIPSLDICRIGDLADIRREIVMELAKIGKSMQECAR